MRLGNFFEAYEAVLKAFVAVALALFVDELETTSLAAHNPIWLQQFQTHCLQAYSALIWVMPPYELQKDIKFTADQRLEIREMTREIWREYWKHCKTIAVQTKIPLAKVQMELDIFAICWDDISRCFDFITEMICEEVKSYEQAYEDTPEDNELTIK